MTYAKLKEMGVNLGMAEAVAALQGAGARVIERDATPENVSLCTTTFHGKATKATRPPAHFMVAGFDGHEKIFVCRYCLLLLGHGVVTMNVRMLEHLLKKAQTESGPPPEDGVLDV